MREKIELEYSLNSSARVLFARLSTPEGLSEWFADEVTVDGDIFIFKWQKSETRARLAALKENKMVRFEWPEKEDDGANFFEFRINIHELTGDLALIVTDFIDPDEKEDTINLWNTQITELRRILGT